MAWLTINGIEVARVAAIDSSPASKRRDIGSESEASDGTTVKTRQTRKRDLTFGTKPLSGDDAFAWESLLTGAGHVWSFDSSFYSSKGLGPSLNEGSLESTSPDPVFGAGYARLGAGEQLDYTVNYSDDVWTVAFWAENAAVDATGWHHFMTRGSGGWFIDGVLYPGLPTLPLNASLGGAVFSFEGPVAGPCNIDDLVILPYLWPDDWAAQVFAAGAPFGPAPYLTAAGLLVPEAATRTMICSSCDEAYMVANLGDGAGRQHDVRRLSVELKQR